MNCKKPRNIAENILFYSLILLALPPVANAAVTDDEQSAASMVLRQPGAKEGKTFLSLVLQKVKALQDYEFESSLTSYSKAKPETETGSFYFKAPNLVRFEAISAGALSGSVVVRQADGKVRAKSRAFFGMTMSLSPTSKLLKTPNGYNILESDLASLISSVLSSLQGDFKCVVTDSAAPYPGLKEPAYILEVIQGAGPVVQRLALDSENKLPLEWNLYRDNKLYSTLHIQKLSINPKLADNLFALDVNEGGAKSLDGGGAAAVEKFQDMVSGLNESSKLDLPLLYETKFAIKTLKLQCDSIEADAAAAQSAAAGKNKSTDVAAEAKLRSAFNQNTLVNVAAIESIANSLSKLKNGFANLKSESDSANNTGAPTLTKRWQQSLANINQTTSRIYDILNDSVPDTKSILLEVRKIKSESLLLDSMVDEIARSI